MMVLIQMRTFSNKYFYQMASEDQNISAVSNNDDDDDSLMIVPDQNSVMIDQTPMAATINTHETIQELKKAKEFLTKTIHNNASKHLEQMSKLAEENFRFKQKINTLSSRNYEYQILVDQLNLRIGRLEDQIKKMSSTQTTYQERIKQANQQIQMKTENNKFKESKITKLESKLAQKEEEIETIKKQYESLVTQNKEQSRRLQIISNQKYQINAMYLNKKQQVEHLKLQNRNLLQSAQNLKNSLKMQLNVFKTKINETEMSKARLQKEIEEQIENQNQLINQKKYNEENSLCVICLDKRASRGLYPCGHITYCEDCVANIVQCSLCNTAVQHKFQFFGMP